MVPHMHDAQLRTRIMHKVVRAQAVLGDVPNAQARLRHKLATSTRSVICLPQPRASGGLPRSVPTSDSYRAAGDLPRSVPTSDSSYAARARGRHTRSVVQLPQARAACGLPRAVPTSSSTYLKLPACQVVSYLELHAASRIGGPPAVAVHDAHLHSAPRNHLLHHPL